MNYVFKDKKNEFLVIKDCFKKAEHCRAFHYLIYNVIRGADMSKGFTPVTSQNKLDNGLTANHALISAKRAALYWLCRPDALQKIFGPTLTEDHCKEISRIINYATIETT